MNNTQSTEAILLRELDVKYNVKDRKKCKISSSKDAYEQFKVLFENDMGLDMVESFYVLYLSNQNNVIGWIKLSQGGITGTLARLASFTPIELNSSGLTSMVRAPWGKTTTEIFLAKRSCPSLMIVA